MPDLANIDRQQSVIAPELLVVEQLALLIHKSPSSIRSDASRNPEALPPICRLPGNKRLLFRLDDVRAWLAAHVHRAPSAASYVAAAVPRGRGRPRKVAA